MKAHGNFDISRRENIIHVYPRGGFNDLGIRDVRDRVLELAPKDATWGLIEHPRDLAGLTPEAAAELLASYKAFAHSGCKIITLEICATWQGVIEGVLRDRLDIPIFMGQNLSHLLKLMDTALD